jgi:hypothetical protein
MSWDEAVKMVLDAFNAFSPASGGTGETRLR